MIKCPPLDSPLVMLHSYIVVQYVVQMIIEGASIPAGISFDLTNQLLLEGSEGVEIISHTSSFKAVRFINQSLGEWSLQVRLEYALHLHSHQSRN